MSLNFVIPEMQLNGAETSPLQFFRRGFLLNGTAGSGPSWQDIVLSGNGSLTLTNAKANGINYLKLFGGTEQTGTPTPTVPVDIVCNNGAIKYSLNMANVNEQTASIGYYISNSGVVTADTKNWIYQVYIPVEPSTTYTLTISTPVYYVTISEYSTADDGGFIRRNAGSTGGNTTLTITTRSTTNYIRFGANIDSSDVTLNKVLSINWMLNKGNSLPYAPYSEDGIFTDGTVETVKINTTGDTATAEMLLSVGDYTDTQEVLSGVVTRNLGIKVLDGTEDGWTKANNSFSNSTLFANKKVEKSQLFCSHFQYDSGSTTNILDMCIGCAATSANTYFRYNTLSTVENWTQWLKDQYNTGFPVIVIYPLATATTETVTAQHLGIQAGTNIVEITQASINNLPLEVSYKGTV